MSHLREVICINNSKSPNATVAPPLEVGKLYTVFDHRKCKCGKLMYDVGLGIDCEMLLCCQTCDYMEVTPDIWWCSAKRFVEVDELYTAGEKVKEEFINNFKNVKELWSLKTTQPV